MGAQLQVSVNIHVADHMVESRVCQHDSGVVTISEPDNPGSAAFTLFFRNRRHALAWLATAANHVEHDLS